MTTLLNNSLNAKNNRFAFMYAKVLFVTLLALPTLGFAQRVTSPEFVTENARGMTDVFNGGFDVVP